MAVQLAHLAGAYVGATASAANAELVKSLGADEVIAYRSEDFSQLREVDVVLDTVGGATLQRSWDRRCSPRLNKGQIEIQRHRSRSTGLLPLHCV